MAAICHRFFYALQPPVRERALIGVYRDAIADAHGHVSNERLHLTIGITDDFESYPRHLEREMLAIGDEAAGTPFGISLDRLSGSARSIALRPSRRIGGLSNLHRQLDHSLSRRRIRRRDWSFSPHATLAYRTGKPFQQPVTPVAWDAVDFVLIHSEVGATRHHELGRWKLDPCQGSFDF